jgi:alpha-glucosidase
MHRTVLMGLLAIAWVCPLAAIEPAAAGTSRAEVVTISPGRRLSITLGINPNGAPVYNVSFEGKPIVGDSVLGLSLEQGGAFGSLREVRHTSATVDETYRLIAGKTSQARNHYAEQSVSLEEVSEPHRRVDLTFRAYDDAVAFRYTLPAQPGLSDFALTAEDSTFALPPDAQAWWLPLPNFTTPHEARYRTSRAADVPAGQLIGLPMLFHVPAGPWVAIAEANLNDYAGMYLTPLAGKAGAFTSAFAPLPGERQVKVRGRAPHASPWRVVMVGDEPGRLIESNVILNLSEPCALADTSWIKPGKVSFLWWNAYVVASPNVVGPLNTATLLKYVDFAAENHIAFASIDGNDHAWYGGPCAPYQGADVTVALPELDLPAIFAHAKERGVRMRIWVNYHGLKLQLDKALETYARWGAEGVMVDMIERDDQEAVNLMRRIVMKCAELHMTVTFHNVKEPTGLERTYPNLRTREAVLNLEYNKWDPLGSSPQHDLTVPFIRMLAGPLDFHQGGFRSVLPKDFKPQYIAPVVMGTRCHQMAMYVVYEDALPMIVDFPDAYKGQEGFKFICEVPTTWDETHVLDGAVGERLTIARRKGRDWYIGSMAGAAPAQLRLPLSFLASGVAYDAQTWSDDAPHGPNATLHHIRRVTSADMLEVSMSAAGGHVVHLVPSSAPLERQ